MAPRHRSARELSAQLASLPKHKIGRFLKSFTDKESRVFATYSSKRNDLDDLSKQIAAIALLGPDEMLSAIAALPKEQQDAYVASMSSNIEKAVSYGDHTAEALAIGYREQLDHLYPKTTWYEQALQVKAKTLKQLGIADRDIEKERKGSQAMVVELLGHWERMRTVLQCYEGLIQTRWLKLTRSQRKEILLTAWPDMPEAHRPDMAQFFSGERFKIEGFDMRSGIWPYINLEDLLRPKALLIFLNSRGRNHPSNFAYSDLELAPMYKTRKEYIALLDRNYTMDFLSGKDSMSYGAWIEWDDETKATESVRAGRTVHFEHGTQILNIQVTIMRFLVYCTTQILYDIDWAQLPPAVPEPARLSD